MVKAPGQIAHPNVLNRTRGVRNERRIAEDWSHEVYDREDRRFVLSHRNMHVRGEQSPLGFENYGPR